MTELSLKLPGMIYCFHAAFIASECIHSQSQSLKASQKPPPVSVLLLKRALLDIARCFGGYVWQPLLEGSDGNRTETTNVMLRNTAEGEEEKRALA